MLKLNQILAVEKQTKATSAEKVTNTLHRFKKEALFQGLSKVYRPKAEDDIERFPDEKQIVQARAFDELENVKDAYVPLIDTTAQRDLTNCNAKADVVVGDKVLLRQVPAITLLWLEKNLIDIVTIVKAIPTLSPTEEWRWDDNQRCFASEAVETSKSKKISKPLVKYEATDKHPAQVEMVNEDILQGFWKTIKYSGAMRASDANNLRVRAEALLAAVKQAREQANMTPVAQPAVASTGHAIFDYLLQDIA